MARLSVIIPVYNAEKFLGRCIDSIEKQNNSVGVEVIIVNDGSTDASLQIAENYVRKYDNIKLLSQGNKGASAARNAGLDVAKGDYIWFVDADDYVSENALKKLSEQIETNNIAEVVCFNHLELNTNGECECEIFEDGKSLTGLEYLQLHTSMYIWDKLFRKSVIGDTRFLNGISNTEDMLFTLQIMMKANAVDVCTDSIYVYNLMNPNSTLSNRKLSNLLKNSNDTMTVHKKILEMLNWNCDAECSKEINDILNYGVTCHLFALFYDRIPSCYIKNVLDNYKSMNLYPIKESYNKKGNLFNLFVNNQRLFLLIVDCLRKMRDERFVADVK